MAKQKPKQPRIDNGNDRRRLKEHDHTVEETEYEDNDDYSDEDEENDKRAHRSTPTRQQRKQTTRVTNSSSNDRQRKRKQKEQNSPDKDRRSPDKDRRNIDYREDFVALDGINLQEGMSGTGAAAAPVAAAAALTVEQLQLLLAQAQQQAATMPALQGAQPLPVNGQPAVPVNGQPAVAATNANALTTVKPAELQLRSTRRKRMSGKDPKWGAPKIVYNEGIKTLIKESIKDVIFRKIKFISSDNQQGELANQIYSAIAMVNYQGGPEEFRRVYANYCLNALNSHRNYIVGRARSVCLEYMDEHNGVPPTFVTILQIALRNVPEDASPALKRLAVWYHGTLLPQFTGLIDWGKPKMYFEHVSMAHFPNSPNKFRVPPNTEAFLVLVCDGHMPVWKAQWDWRKQYGKGVPYPDTRMKLGAPVPQENEKFACKYTKPNGGSDKFGGWKEEALLKFTVWKAEITLARKKPTNFAFEEEVMQSIRDNAGVTHGTLTEWLQSKKKRKTPVPVVQKENPNLFGDEE